MRRRGVGSRRRNDGFELVGFANHMGSLTHSQANVLPVLKQLLSLLEFLLELKRVLAGANLLFPPRPVIALPLYEKGAEDVG